MIVPLILAYVLVDLPDQAAKIDGLDRGILRSARHARSVAEDFPVRAESDHEVC